MRSYSQPDLWVVDATPGSAPKNLTATYDFDVSGGIGGDQSAPRGEQPKPIVWTKDGLSLIVTTAENGSSNLKRVLIANGQVEPVTTGQHDVVAYTATPERSTIAATISTQTNIGDIAIVRDADRAAQAVRPPDHARQRRRSSRTSTRASPKRSGTAASTAGRSRAGS